MNLSEDGVLVIETNRQRLMLFARSEKDLEKCSLYLLHIAKNATLTSLFREMKHGVFMFAILNFRINDFINCFLKNEILLNMFHLVLYDKLSLLREK